MGGDPIDVSGFPLFPNRTKIAFLGVAVATSARGHTL